MNRKSIFSLAAAAAFAVAGIVNVDSPEHALTVDPGNLPTIGEAAKDHGLDGKTNDLDGKTNNLDGKVNELDGKVNELDGSNKGDAPILDGCKADTPILGVDGVL